MLEKLDKPICVYDIESTGLNTAKDKIVSLAITKLHPDGNKDVKYVLMNPMMPIPKEASDIHKITDDQVVDKPKFSNLAKGIREFFGDCYIAGYNNNRFDNELLQEEFSRCGIEYPTRETISLDACAIFQHFERRDLTAALRFFCGETMENAHNAGADVDATVKILLAQMKHYEEFKDKSLTEISRMFKPENYVDVAGKIIVDEDGDFCYNFGPQKGKKIKNEKGFAEWLLKKECTDTLRLILTKELGR